MSAKRTRRYSTASIARMPSRRTITSARRRSEHQSEIEEKKKFGAGTADLRHKKKNMTDRISKLYRAKAQLRDVVTDLTFEKITNWTEFESLMRFR